MNTPWPVFPLIIQSVRVGDDEELLAIPLRPRLSLILQLIRVGEDAPTFHNPPPEFPLMVQSVSVGDEKL